MSEGRSRILERLAAWHAQIDGAAGKRSRALGDHWRCAPGCSDCCRDGLTVYSVEALRICVDFAGHFENWEPHPPGKCALLDDRGLCRVYASRPYVCRTQGLALGWIEEGPEGLVEWRDICPINEKGLRVEALPAEALWRIGPAEGKLVEIERRWDPAAERVALRALFDSRLRQRLLGTAGSGPGEEEAGGA
ncbi:MAG: YkgJ family cysteine cluster protein [Acidobacteriota bacterium]|nr:YkgJ family cysteine cluster protein [Acidobacteriota bacterium]MDQ7088249.1 YkgJ family cysteine cluster protein [Acidobacteriota bacterium]